MIDPPHDFKQGCKTYTGFTGHGPAIGLSPELHHQRNLISGFAKPQNRQNWQNRDFFAGLLTMFELRLVAFVGEDGEIPAPDDSIRIREPAHAGFRTQGLAALGGSRFASTQR